MSAVPVLDQLTTTMAARKADHDAAFHALAVEIADGKAPDPDRVEEVLAAAGRAIPDLRSAVDLLIRRRRLAETAAEGKKAESESEQVRRQQAAVDAELEVARRKHEQATAILAKRRHDLGVVVQHGVHAAIELRNSADGKLVARARAASAAVERRRGTLAALQAESNRIEARLPRLREEAVATVAAMERGHFGPMSRETPADAKARFQRETAQHEGRRGELPGLIDRAGRELAEAEVEVEAADAAVLKTA